jgi:hypothetical protein
MSTDYSPPLDDIGFVLERVTDLAGLLELDDFKHADLETVIGALEEAGRFMSEVIAPTNRPGDQIGSVHDGDASVITPPGFREAYGKFVASGWGAIGYPLEAGGAGLPWLIGLVVQEMFTSSNMAFSLGPMLTQGAVEALLFHGSDEQRAIYLDKLSSGEWTGTMVLTEPEAGSDVGALRTKAVPNQDGTYSISGTKIFISWGEHDLTDNIIHMVLARTPDAPPGTRGISMFLVPKFLVNQDGTLGDRNTLKAVSLEHKMGIHASPHVHDDEQRPVVRRPRGPGGIRAGLSTSSCLRSRAGSGEGDRCAQDRALGHYRTPRYPPDADDDQGLQRGNAVRVVRHCRGLRPHPS